MVIDGEVGKPGTYALEDFVKPYQLEERIYRLRCVEAWSMVIPWLGFPGGPAQAGRTQWAGEVRPFRNPAASGTDGRPTLRFLGDRLALYGRLAHGRGDASWQFWRWACTGGCCNQNGAPLRLVVPWKYGFKSIKSIVRISLVREQPKTTWGKHCRQRVRVLCQRQSAGRPPAMVPGSRAAPAQWVVQPNVRDTQMFNGYGARSLPFIAAWI